MAHTVEFVPVLQQIFATQLYKKKTLFIAINNLTMWSSNSTVFIRPTTPARGFYYDPDPCMTRSLNFSKMEISGSPPGAGILNSFIGSKNRHHTILVALISNFVNYCTPNPELLKMDPCIPKRRTVDDTDTTLGHGDLLSFRQREPCGERPKVKVTRAEVTQYFLPIVFPLVPQ